MKQQRKIYNFFFSTTWGTSFFVFLLALFFVTISAAYLYWQGDFSFKVIFSKKIIIALEPLAVLIIGIASIIIATISIWGKLGHKITLRFTPSLILKINRIDMLYIASIILINKKNKVEIIDKILFYSKKLEYTTVADFSEKPLALKNYATETIPLEPVTAWVTGINEEDIKIKTSIDIGTEYKTIINTIREGADPKFYSAPYNYLYKKIIRNSKIFAVISGVLIPVKLDSPKFDLQLAFPIRNTDHPANEYQEEKAIYGPRLIMATELTLGPSTSGKKPDNKEIKVLLYSNQEKFHFDSYIEENLLHDFMGLSEISTTETRDFEKKWQEYYNRIKDSYEKNSKENKDGTSSYAQALEDDFHKKIALLFAKQDLPRISSRITSRIFFLQNVQEFGEYLIVNKRHTLFATGFYPTEEGHPCFEEEEESKFAKIRKWCFEEAPPTSQKNAETDKRTK